jgi:glycosyltransferase involved in cell wall biosynthesis
MAAPVDRNRVRAGIRRVVSAIMFFPRGGSAYAAREVARRLPEHGWRVRLVAGSCADRSPYADATRFYHGIDLSAIEFGSEVPMHPSYEDRRGSSEPVFAALDGAAFERQVSAWARPLLEAGADQADLLHLHHLTPLNEAAFRVAPGVPVVGQLHGTELLMLERIDAGNPDGWPFADAWRSRMLDWARRCERVIVAPGAVERVVDALEVEADRLVEISNGFDERLFQPRDVDRGARWRQALGVEPRGVVLAYVGRFTEVKRVPALVRAFAAAEPRFERPASLVLIGGFPDETEGEDPVDAIRAAGTRNVFLTGWRPHEQLPDLLNAADAILLPSAREQFGQALVEGMACGLPAIATRCFGPASIVDDGRTGWLVEPDDERALSDALVAAVNDEAERRRRGRAAYEAVRHRYAWSVVAAAVDQTFADAVRAVPPARAVTSVTSV